jgi:hypothetical protein
MWTRTPPSRTLLAACLLLIACFCCLSTATPLPSHWNLTANSVGSQPVSLSLDSDSAAAVTTIRLNFSHAPIDTNTLVAWMSGDNCATTPNSVGSGTLLTPSDSASPSARRNSVTWTSPEGYLHIYGGYFGGSINDLWRYTPHTRQWQWLWGSSTPVGSISAVYNTRRVESPGAVTGDAFNGCSAVDPLTGYVYIYGGGGNPFSGQWKGHAEQRFWMLHNLQSISHCLSCMDSVHGFSM